MSFLLKVLWFEIKTLLKKPQRMVESSIFFVILTSIFPIAMDADILILKKIAPMVILISLLFVVIFQCQIQLRQEYEEGSLEQWLLSCESMPSVVLAKWMSLVIQIGLPLGFILPFVTYAYGLEQSLISWYAIIGLTLPLMVILSYFGAALTLGLKRDNVLLSVLILPLLSPVLVFGASGLLMSAASESIAVPLSVLGAFLAVCIGFMPHVVAALMKVMYE